MKARLIFNFLLSVSVNESSVENAVINVCDHCNRFIIITADDYGAARNINEGIRIAVENHLVTDISALTNFQESISSLKSISDNYPYVGIGVHLNITTGKPLSDPAIIPSLVDSNGNFFTIYELIPRLKKIPLKEIKTELIAQVQILADSGIRVNHLSDQYGILSLYPPCFDIMIQLAKDYNLPIRSPVIASLQYPSLFPHSLMRQEGYKIFKSVLVTHPGSLLSLAADFELNKPASRAAKLDKSGIKHPDLLIDYFYGNPSFSNLEYIFEKLPPGINELVLHLGTSERQTEYPTGLDLGYMSTRELELQTISSCSLNDILKNLKIEKISYSDINMLRNQ